MSYEDLKQSAAIICTHISYPEHPILRATRDDPLEPEDSGWQFLCGTASHGESRGLVVALNEVAAMDPSLLNILDSKPKVSFERSTVDTPWPVYPTPTNAKSSRCARNAGASVVISTEVEESLKVVWRLQRSSTEHS